ncbi:MAG: Hpt domain-containing protein [Lachnospiraceae bacterium]|nr:Hpt domain-containing protein [Lachnospiraceae bacterium]
MDEGFKKQLEESGADVDVTLKRFMGNEAIYMKFILKFLDDKNYDVIMDSLDNKDYAGAFAGAHSLKGVSGNLGLNPVYEASSQITELLRDKSADEIDTVKLAEVQEQLRKSYCRFQEIIKSQTP